jgi:hypothetical protein
MRNSFFSVIQLGSCIQGFDGNLPTRWQLPAPGDAFTARMFAALNGMMLDC